MDFEINEKKYKSCSHNDSIRYTILFEERKYVVSCSDDHSVMVWNFSETIRDIQVPPVLVQTFEDHGDYVRHVLKWNNDLFISSADDGRVILYSLKTMKKIKEFECFKSRDTYEGSYIIRLFRDTEDSFWVFASGCFLYRISFSEDQFLGEYSLGEGMKVFSQTEVKKSIICGDHVYLNLRLGGDFEIIYKINTSVVFDPNSIENEVDVLKSLKFDDTNEDLYSVCVFKNRRNEEIVATGGNVVYLLDSRSLEIITTITPSPRAVANSNYCTHLCNLRNKYVLMAFDEEELWFYDIENEQKRSYHIKVCESTFLILPIEIKRNEVKMLVCTSDSYLSAFSIKGMKDLDSLSEKMEKEDAKERMEFVCSCVDEFFFGEKRFIKSLSLSNKMLVDDIPKVLFVL